MGFLSPLFLLGLSSVTYDEFSGITILRYVGSGILKLKWNSNADPDTSFYRLYISLDENTVFDESSFLMKISSNYTESLIRTLADGTTLIEDYSYYIGVRSELSNGDTDLNVIIKVISPINDLSYPLEIPDRKMSKII